jgi:hypothetical protein
MGKTHAYLPVQMRRGGGALAVKARINIPVPNSLAQAEVSDFAAEWRDAVELEMQRLLEMETWELVKPPPQAHILTCKWVFDLKTKPDGSVERFKARLTIRGFAQKEGVDYEETYANTAAKTSVRAFFAMVCYEGLETKLMDVSTAFLYGDVDKEIYMQQPAGYNDGSKRVCRLKRSLYGLKQAPRIWQEELKDKLLNLGFEVSAIDESLYRLELGPGRVVYLLDWVDDMVGASKDLKDLDWVYQQLHRHYKIKDDGPVQRYVGIWITRDLSRGELWLHQEPYILDAAEELKTELPTRACKVPLPTDFTLPRPWELAGEDPPEGHKEPRDEPLSADDVSRFQQLVGKLNYVAQAVRLDVAYAANQLSRCQQKPFKRHWRAALHALAYLMQTAHLGLHFTKTSGMVLEAFSDANYNSHDPSAKCMTGVVLTCGGAAISWVSRKQDRITTSTCDSESLAIMTTVQHVEHARDLLEALDQLQNFSTNVYCDNTATVSLSHDPVAHKKSIQLTRPMAYVREKTKLGVISPLHVRTTDQAADFLTKALPAVPFERCRNMVGLHEVPGLSQSASGKGEL